MTTLYSRQYMTSLMTESNIRNQLLIHLIIRLTLLTASPLLQLKHVVTFVQQKQIQEWTESSNKTGNSQHTTKFRDSCSLSDARLWPNIRKLIKNACWEKFKSIIGILFIIE